MSGKSILLVGSARDRTIRHSAAAFRRQGRQIQLLDLDAFCTEGVVEGRLSDAQAMIARIGDTVVQFSLFNSCYARFVDIPSTLPADKTGAAWGRHRMLEVTIRALANSTLVVNRPNAGESNNSKPYQTSLLQRHGFWVPRSCSTNIPEAASDFLGSCARGAIYKSNSGERSIVQAVTNDDRERLALLPACPVFFQERISGANIRVHVIRDECFAVLIRAPSVDYRYDNSGAATERPFVVPHDIATNCISVTRTLSLEFAGIDLVLSDDDGHYYCLEVNPMPGYHGYDHCLDFAISECLGRLLSAGNSGRCDARIPAGVAHPSAAAVTNKVSNDH